MLSSLALAPLAFAPSAHARWRGSKSSVFLRSRTVSLNARPTLYEQVVTSWNASVVKIPSCSKPRGNPPLQKPPACPWLTSPPSPRGEPSPRHSPVADSTTFGRPGTPSSTAQTAFPEHTLREPGMLRAHTARRHTGRASRCKHHPASKHSRSSCWLPHARKPVPVARERLAAERQYRGGSRSPRPAAATTAATP